MKQQVEYFLVISDLKISRETQIKVIYFVQSVEGYLRSFDISITCGSNRAHSDMISACYLRSFDSGTTRVDIGARQ